MAEGSGPSSDTFSEGQLQALQAIIVQAIQEATCSQVLPIPTKCELNDLCYFFCVSQKQHGCQQKKKVCIYSGLSLLAL